MTRVSHSKILKMSQLTVVLEENQPRQVLSHAIQRPFKPLSEIAEELKVHDVEALGPIFAQAPWSRTQMLERNGVPLGPASEEYDGTWTYTYTPERNRRRAEELVAGYFERRMHGLDQMEAADKISFRFVKSLVLHTKREGLYWWGQWATQANTKYAWMHRFEGGEIMDAVLYLLQQANQHWPEEFAEPVTIYTLSPRARAMIRVKKELSDNAYLEARCVVPEPVSKRRRVLKGLQVVIPPSDLDSDSDESA